MSIFKFRNRVETEGDSGIIEHPVTGSLYYSSPFGVRYIDEQGNIIITLFPLFSYDQLEEVRKHVRSEMKRWGWKRVLIFDLNKTTLTPAGG